MRALKLFFCCFMAAAFTGCASYHLGPANGAVAGDKSVEVLPFNNQTLQPRLGDAITQAVRQRLQADATFHLATSQPGDIVVTGVILWERRFPLAEVSSWGGLDPDGIKRCPHSAATGSNSRWSSDRKTP